VFSVLLFNIFVFFELFVALKIRAIRGLLFYNFATLRLCVKQSDGMPTRACIPTCRGSLGMSFVLEF